MPVSARRLVHRLRRVHPATYIAALAVAVAISDVGPADAVRAVKRAVFADNAGSVNGIKASRKPRAGRLVPLGADGRFSASVVPSGGRGPRGTEGPRGPTGPQGAIGPRGPSSARIVTPGAVPLARTEGVFTTVATLANVSAGSYLAMFMAEANYRTAAVRMYVVCQLRVNGTVVGGTKGIVGEIAGSTGSLNLALIRPVTRADAFDLAVTCTPDQPTPAGGTPGELDNQALAVVKLDSVGAE